MERKVLNKIEKYMSVDFYESQTPKNISPYSLIMDISDSRPGEIEIEDDIREFLLWRKVYKKFK